MEGGWLGGGTVTPGTHRICPTSSDPVGSWSSWGRHFGLGAGQHCCTHQRKSAVCRCAMHLKMVKMVNSESCAFYHNQKKGGASSVNHGLEVIILEPHWLIDFNKHAPQCNGEGGYGGTVYFLLNQFSCRLKRARKE